MAPHRLTIFLALGLAAGAAGAVAAEKGFIARLFGGGEPGQLLLSGNIEAHESVLSVKAIESRIVELPFDEGQWVTQGTLIARLDDSDYAQQVVMAEAALAVQQRQLDSATDTLAAARKTVISDEADLELKRIEDSRNEKLWKQGWVSTDTRDQFSTAYKQSAAALDRDQSLVSVAERNVELDRANVRSAEEALKLARITRGYTTVTAPYAGVILVRQAELGEIVLPGTPVATLADLDHVWLRAYVNETDIAKVRLGQAVSVTTDSYPGKSYPGRISFIAGNAEFTPKTVETHQERVTLVYRIKIDIDNPTHELVPGLPADAHIALQPAGTS
ncbi:MAG TPA: HlyD family efflux transporter periplasmic adaptor subunit [Stellaceae bacterium]|nr:HlyD family efflux transporter periplasmic adaptor subunit [Stellaceae bacterium]